MAPMRWKRSASFSGASRRATIGEQNVLLLVHVVAEDAHRIKAHLLELFDEFQCGLFALLGEWANSLPQAADLSPQLFTLTAQDGQRTFVVREETLRALGRTDALFSSGAAGGVP